MLIWPLLSILNLHQTNFIGHSKNLLNECKLVTLLLAIMIHLWTILISEFTRDWWCFTKPGDDSLMSLRSIGCEPGFDWHATCNWWPDDGMGSRADKMSPDTRHLSLNYYPGPCALLSPQIPWGGGGILNVEYLNLSVARPLLFLTYTESLARLELISNLIQMI